ncbi:MAG TPA: glycoside hydrolase family 16 protein [Mycobacteriales bacterium]|nr:glycoside hydrolase family 16 protein [Mycobacteriales bacterium]
MHTPIPGTRFRRRPLVVGATVAFAVALVSLAVSTPATADAPAPEPGWTLDFSDNFDGPAGTGLSTGNWLYDLGTSYPGGAANWGTGEVESMTNSTANVFTDGAGHLAIKPVRAANGSWTSGRVETQRTDFAAPAGGILRVQASIQQPNVSGAAAAGYWPAFWMLGAAARPVAAANWPGVGEIDVMEDINGLSSEFSTLHCGVSPGGPCNETTGIGSGQHACAGCQTGFHTYTMEYDRSVSPEQLRWYLDGVNFFTVNQTQVDATTWNNALHHGFFVIFDVAMGGGFPAAFGGGPTGATASGVPMLVDYVAVYQKAGTGSGGGTPTPTPTPTQPPSSRDAYSTIQAEGFDQQSGVQAEATTDTGGGQDIGFIANGDWALYRGVDFGSAAARQFVARVASGAGGGVSGLVEVRIDSRSNPPVGSFAIANTGGWQSWRSVPANITGVTGVHDVYLTFTSGQPADFVNLNWFTFGH